MRIGIDLGGTKIEIIALADNGETLFRKRIPTPQGDYAATLAAIAALVREAERETGRRATVGIGIPGTVSPFSGTVKNANTTWLNGRPLDRDLADLIGRDVRVANDANCMAVSEAADGAGADAAIVLALILGTGCGSGIVIGGVPHHGANGIAGEWGHNPLPWMDSEESAIAEAYPCYCGRKGCIETFVSGTGLCRDYQWRSGQALTGEAIVALAEKGDTAAEQSIAAYERRLAKSLAAFINVLDPDVVIFAGGVCNIDRLYANVPALLPPYIIGGECRTPIRKALHGDASGVRGAAWLWPIPGENA